MRLIDHHFATIGESLPPVDESLLYDYVVASNAVFARGRRPGLEVSMPVGFSFINALGNTEDGSPKITGMNGLAKLFPYVQWGFPRVPKALVLKMLLLSQFMSEHEPMEVLFHLAWESDRWELEVPQQHGTANSVVPLATGVGTSTERAIIEVHSHHTMTAEFSPADDRDEAQGFRIYAVIGRIFDRPEIRARVGLFGHFFEYPAAEFFALPAELTDCIKELN